MTTPNLDKLAALAPFRFAHGADTRWVEGKDGFVCLDDLVAIANEWAELRAYKQRTEAERSEMLRLLAYCRPRVQSYEQCNETYCADGHDHEVHKRIDDLLTAAERDPALKVRVLIPKEASDGK